MDLSLKIDESLIFSGLRFNKKEEVIAFLADELAERGYVTENYKQALLDREKDYPTGLPSHNFNIAIPHADYKQVKQTTVAIGILEEPIQFYSMEDMTEPVDISIVIMLAINEPHGQIEMLQRIVKVIQDDSLRQNLVENFSEKSLTLLLNYLNGRS